MSDERARLLLYSLLTQAIILLGTWRARLIWRSWVGNVPGRVFDVYRSEVFACCDCGLEHAAEYFGPAVACGHRPAKYAGGEPIVGHMYPRRPVGYDYGWRYGAARSDLAEPCSPQEAAD